MTGLHCRRRLPLVWPASAVIVASGIVWYVWTLTRSPGPVAVVAAMLVILAVPLRGTGRLRTEPVREDPRVAGLSQENRTLKIALAQVEGRIAELYAERAQARGVDSEAGSEEEQYMRRLMRDGR